MPLQITLDIQQILAQKNFGVVPTTPDADLLALIATLRPVATDLGLVRDRRAGDGGYLVPDCLADISACFSPGVGHTSAFEQELAQRGIRSFLADFSVEKPSTDNPLFSFEKKFVGDVNDDRHIRLEDWVARCAEPASADLLLQMDIEGAEYQVILDTPTSVCCAVSRHVHRPTAWTICC